MFPGMNKKMLEQAMKQLNVKQEEIDADEVIIKGSQNLIIKDPKVVKMEIMGQETLQITGKIEELISEDDIKTVMEQANTSREKAIKALNESNGDLASAILSLKA
ncbi:MAG: Nascent polypeptide-associated complex protein [archaeon GW2011_AR20]|nr:MAG: Nascent polypeptide-associated complex protein [archaeon GW2011_AR20]MBS3160775.1 nascent polypeptide-associated complex protein [Candidatus Woesearchaeota archaeon]